MGARIFLSYGHRDAGDLAAKLRTDLDRRAGYKVWQDIDGIRLARGWSSEIADALRDSDVVIALLSPHSVRRATDPDNPEGKDSVCIDEIEYAVDGVRIPVVPVMVKTCEAPFRIFRLQYLDFRRWQESDAHYNELVEQLADILGTTLQTGQSPTRTWGFLPEPWDFSPFLADRRKRFTGRDWLFAEIENWRDDPTSRSMLIVGGPGVGKSAIVAQLVYENPDGQVLAYHCCQADTPTTLSAATFVRSIAGQLSSRVEGYASALKTPKIQDALSVAEVESDPASAFEAGVLAPLAALPEPDDAPQYILVDALDEALLLDEGTNVLNMLVTRLARFPTWLRLVATTRPKPNVLRKLRGLKSQLLDAEDPRNRADVRTFAINCLEDPRFDNALAQVGKSRDEMADLLLEVSSGNFLYVTQALDAVGKDQLTIADVLELPPGLGSLYEIFFDRLFVRQKVPFEPTRRVLETVIASLEPPNRAELAAVTGLDQDYELPNILGTLAAFVPARDGRYSVFHASVTEWLTGWDAKFDQPITENYHVSPVAGHTHWADHLLKRYDDGDRGAPDVIQRLPSHLTGARKWDDLSRVLTDWRFLETKVTGATSSVFDLLIDYNLATGSIPGDHHHTPLLRLLGEILSIDGQFIAAHPETLFQCFWNRGYWHDSPVAHEYFELGISAGRNGGSPALWEFVDKWRAERRDKAKTPWIRYIRPPTERLGSAQQAVLVGHTDALKHVAVSPDGARLVSADGEDGANVKLWELASGSELLSRNLGQEKDPQGIAFAPDGTRLVVAHWDGTVSTLDADTLETTASLRITEENLNVMAICDDGRWAVIGDWKGYLHLVDLEAWEVVRSEKLLDGTVEGVAFSPDGQWIIAGDQSFGCQSSVVLCRRPSLRVERKFASEAWITSVTFAPDGESVAWANYDGQVRLHHLESGSETVLQDVATRDRFGNDKVVAIGSMCFLGKLVLVGTEPVWGNADILVWDAETKKILHRLPGHQFGISALAAIDERGRFASAGDSTVRVWDLGRIAGETAEAKEPEVGHLLFSPVTATVITGAVQSERVWVRSVEDGSLVQSLEGHGKGVHALQLGPNGRHLACGAGNGGVHVWDLRSGNLVLANQPHEDAVGAVALSGNGELVASGSNDGTVCVQSLNGAELPLMLTVEDWPNLMAFSPAGNRLAVVALQSLQIWDVDEAALVWKTGKVAGPVYELLFFEDGLVLKGNRRELYGFDAATGSNQKVTTAQQDEWMRRVGYADRTWAWRGTYPSGEEPKEDEYHQHMAELFRIDTRESVAWLPLLLGGVHYFPNRPIWANRRGDSAWVFRLEDGDEGTC